MLSDGCSNVVSTLWRQARRIPDRPCLTDLDAGPRGVTLTYRELAAEVSRLAGGLRESGVAQGDRVALLMRNSAEYVVAFLGAVAAGAVVVPLNTRLRESDYRHMLEDSQCTLLITEDAFLDTCPAIREVNSLRAHSVTLHGLRPLQGDRLGEPLDPASGLMSLMYTSGTTGAAKAVMLQHRAWAAVAEMAVPLIGISPDDRVLHVAPLTHGSGFLLLPTLGVGGHTIVCRSFEPARSAELIDSGLVTGMFLVPSMIRMLLDVTTVGWQVPATYRWLYYAGSPIDAETLREAATAFDGRIVQSFAQMESPMFFTALDAADHSRIVSSPDVAIARSAGSLIPGVQLRIVDRDGNTLPIGQNGEILARSPQMMAGYWGREQETATTLRDGWLHTGDVGHLDDSGYLFVVDRLKDMIVTGGSNVYAREVEEVLLRIAGVRDAAVIGVPDRIWGEAVTAILTHDHGAGDSDAVIAQCKAVLPAYRVPKRIHWINELPRNPYGKILKRELRETFSRAVPEGPSS